MRSEMTTRQREILTEIVEQYIATGEPVSSGAIARLPLSGGLASSATIRNEMAELETAGYLVQPHTSAGRVTSDAGYRTYVDQLMRPEPLPPVEARRIRDEFRAASRPVGPDEQNTLYFPS